MVFIAGMETRNIQWCNETMENILGYSMAEMQQMNAELFKTIMHPDDYPNALKAREYFLKGNQRHVAVCRFKGKKDTDWRWFYGISISDDYDNEDNLKTIRCYFFELEETDTLMQAKKALTMILRKTMKEKMKELTPREKELLPFIAGGLNCHQIAKKLYKSFYTIETQLKYIKEKMEVHSRAELIALLKLMGF